GLPRHQRLTVMADGAATPVEVTWTPDGPTVTVANATSAGSRGMRVVGAGNPLYVLFDMHQVELSWPTFEAGAIEDNGDGSSVRAPIVGRVAKVFVKAGDTVDKGDRIAVVEAMKMEHVLHAARAGTIGKVAVAEGQQVAQGALIAALD